MIGLQCFIIFAHMKLKIVNILFLALVILTPVVVYTISSLSDYSDFVTAVEESNEEEQSEDTEEEIEEKDIEYFHSPYTRVAIITEDQFLCYSRKENVLFREIEVSLQPPEFR